MNILIVEDRIDVACAIRSTVASIKAAQNVHMVQNYNDAIALTSKRHYDVFLLDIDLRKSRSGFEVCRAIRQNNKDSIIIFISGFIDENAVKHIYALGGNDLIRKPFVRSEIRLKVIHWRNFIKAGRSKKPCLEYHSMKFNLERSEFSIEGKIIPLTKALRRLVILFLQSPETIIPYNRIQQEVWGDHDTSLQKRNIKERVFELKKRLPKVYAAWITSEAGEGYVLRKG